MSLLRRLLAAVGSRDGRRAIVIGATIALSGCAADPDRATDRQDEVARDPAAMMRIAEAAEHGGDMSGAEAFYRRAAELKPDLAAAEIGEARALAARGASDEAITRLKDAHARAPADTEITGTLGRLLVTGEQPAEALSVFEDGLRVEPRSSSLLVGRGVALDALDRHQEAQAAYRAALAVNPASEPARKDLALSQALARGAAAAPEPRGTAGDAEARPASAGARG